LRLRFDEGAGDAVRNTAPGARAAEFKAEINPLVWGEVSWFWPSARLEMNTRLPLGDVADVDTHEGFSAGGWVMLRGRPGGSGIGTGSLFSRKGDLATLQGRGWEIYVDQYRFVLNLVHDGSKPDDPPKP